ncbi:MAG: diguanylate cyclase domain-containing protein, partial [Actinomycetota bacterium]
MPAQLDRPARLTAGMAGVAPKPSARITRSQPTTATAGLLPLAIGAAVACVAFSTWTALEIGGTFGTRIFDDLVLFGSAALAGAACVPAAIRRRGRQRAAWALVAASCFSWAAGQLAWSYYQLIAGTAVPFPGPSDIGYSASIPLAAAGALVLYRTRGGIAAQARIAVDGLIIAAGSLFVGWTSVLEEAVSVRSGGTLSQALSVYYPAGYIVVVALVLFVFAKTTERGPAITLLGWGMGVNAMASALYAVLTLNGHYYTGHAMDVTWLVSFLLVALGGRCASQQEPPPRLTAADAPTRAGVILPYLPVAVAVVVAVSRLVRGQALGVFLDATGAAIVVLVVVRQLFTLMENASLARGLEEKVTERTAEVASVFKDLIEERRAREADLFRSARHDALTGLPNRTALGEYLNAALSIAEKDARARVVVLFLDLDRFKHINDAFGHAAGDRVLVALGDRLRDSMPEVFLSRFGGDEYVMVTTGPFDNETAYLLAQEVAETLRLPVDVDGSDLHLTGSVGIAVSQPGDTAEDLIRNADTAMYRSKEAGTDGY